METIAPTNMELATHLAASTSRCEFFNSNTYTFSHSDKLFTGLAHLFMTEMTYIQSQKTALGAKGDYADYNGRTLLNWEVIFQSAMKSVIRPDEHFNPDYLQLAMEEIVGKAKREATEDAEEIIRRNAGWFGLYPVDAWKQGEIERAEGSRNNKIQNADFASQAVAKLIQDKLTPQVE